MAKLEGYKKFMKKDQSGLCHIMTYSFPSDQEGAVGRTCKDAFISEDVFKMLTPDMIGKELSIDYSFDHGYPKICGVSIEAVKK